MLFHANTAAWLRARREYKGTGKAGNSRPDAAAPAVPPSAEAGDATQLRVVVPVDGSRDAERAVRHVIGHLAAEGPIEVHLVNVQEPICAWQVKKFLLPEEIARWQRMRAEDALAPARALLDQAGLSHRTHMAIGSPADTILRYAEKMRCGRIVVGVSGDGRFRRLLFPGLAARLVRKSSIPVILIRP
ncbi:MAG: universal stress protein [Rhodocyclales bacterium]|nr:universal stress protein [Rhodocyclales bacterium]